MYAELHARSAFNFLRGSSQPEQLAEMAAGLGLAALALHDRDGVYGAPRFHARAKELGLKPIIGCEVTLEDGFVLPVIVLTCAGYRNLCRLLTIGRLRGTKAASSVTWLELAAHAEGLAALTGDEEGELRHEARPSPRKPCRIRDARCCSDRSSRRMWSGNWRGCGSSRARETIQ